MFGRFLAARPSQISEGKSVLQSLIGKADSLPIDDQLAMHLLSVETGLGQVELEQAFLEFVDRLDRGQENDALNATLSLETRKLAEIYSTE